MAQRYIRPEEYYNTVDVEDYYDKVHRSTWARRVAATLTGGSMGMGYGAMIGAIGAFLPHLLTTLGIAGASAAALPTLGVIAASASLCAIVGSGIGILMVCDVSSNSASVAAGLEELEKRHKVERLQDGVPIRGTAPAKEDDAPMSATIAPRTRLFSWKVALTTASLFALFGAVLAFTPLAPAVALYGLTGTAGVIACAATFGMFGSLIGWKNSLLTNKVENFYFKLITEQYFDHSPKPAKEIALDPEAPAIHNSTQAVVHTPESSKSFAAAIAAERASTQAEQTLRS